MTMEKGFVQIYTGDGKGKTTAAMGLALRAAGRGLRVIIVQFMKGRDSGELRSLALLPGVRVYRTAKCGKFFASMSDTEKEAVLADCRDMLRRVGEWFSEKAVDVLILDEAMGAIHCGAIEAGEFLRLLDVRPDSIEIVLTGRRAPQALIDRADLVTEMVPVKHYFDRGVPAREGIEY
jgi:cob(I)alamin adenosyltransferase